MGTECRGHPAGPNDPMGMTIYCDGSCRQTLRSIRNQKRNKARREKDQAMRDLGLVKCRVNGETIWE